MCGRFLMSEDALEQAMTIARIPDGVQQQLNLGTIYPSCPSLVLIRQNEGLCGTIMDFGWPSPTLKKRLINARAETAAQKRPFAQAVKSRRCVVVCSRFYEWDQNKTMMTFFEQDQPALYMAGVYMEDCFVIITTEANASMRPFHHRMPLLLSKEQAKNWVLDPQCSQTLLKVKPPMVDHLGQDRLF